MGRTAIQRAMPRRQLMYFTPCPFLPPSEKANYYQFNGYEAALCQSYWPVTNIETGCAIPAIYIGRGFNPMGRSRMLLEAKIKRRLARSALSPGQKMAAAFSLSMEARKLRIAALRSQGFGEAEILQILKKGRR